METMHFQKIILMIMYKRKKKKCKILYLAPSNTYSNKNYTQVDRVNGHKLPTHRPILAHNYF